jgi:hypothetical protein
MAAGTGEPSMEDIQATSATQVMKDLNAALEPAKSTATVETVAPGQERPNDPTPRSDNGETTVPNTKPTDPNQQGTSPDAAQQPATPPTQVNEAASSDGKKDEGSAATSSSSSNSKDDKKKDESSSKKKKKKKLGIF